MDIKADIPVSASVTQQVFDLRISNGKAVNMGMDTAVIASAGRHYEGEYEVTPQKDEETILETAGLVMDDNVTVKEIPYYETSNLAGGTTAIIAKEV